MKLIKKLWCMFMADDERGRFFRYAFVGCLNTVVGYAVYWAGIRLGLHFTLAMFFSQAAGTLHSYVWNRNFTFKSKTKDAAKTAKEMLRFFSVCALQYFVNIGITALFTGVLHFSEEIAGLFAILICTVVSYFGHKLWSFR